MVIEIELSDKERKDEETKLFNIFLDSLLIIEFGNGSEKIWEKSLQNFFEGLNKKYPLIFHSIQDLSKLNLRIKMEEVDRIIEEKKASFIVSCYNWVFPFPVHVVGTCSSFSLFNSAIFLQPVAFLYFESEFVEFTTTRFLSGLQMSHHQTCKVKNVKFELCYFERQSHFMEQKFDSFIMYDSRFGDGVNLNFKRTDFSEKVLLLDRNLPLTFESTKACELDLENTIFYCSFDCSLILKIIPDFPKATFLKSKSVEDTWLIDEKGISDVDEPKFRFLKKYFAEQGNHFKEQKYFAYEMMAHEKLLRIKVFSFSKMKKDFYEWFRNLVELGLFFIYKLISNFGMSWVRPLFWLVVSSAVMYCYIEIPITNYFGFFNEFLVFRTEGLSLKEAILKTISPLSTAEEFKHSLPVKIHCFINTILIFLIGLGIRNKFKIK